MKKKNDTITATSEVSKESQSKAERRLDLIEEWIEHIRSSINSPLPRTPDEIFGEWLELTEEFEDELEDADTDSQQFQLGVVTGQIAALDWVLGWPWDVVIERV